MQIVQSVSTTLTFFSGPNDSSSQTNTDQDFKKVFPHYTLTKQSLDNYSENREATKTIAKKSFLIGLLLPAFANILAPKKYRIQLIFRLMPLAVISGTGYAFYHAERKIWEDYTEEVARDFARLNHDAYS